jgi:hypothetical protein
MRSQSRRLGYLIASGALTVGLIAGAPMFLASAQAQQAGIVDPNAPKAGQSSHDAALAAAARRDYVAALELSKKAAAEGQPLEADQVDFISGKAAQQQAQADDAAKSKASQVAAQDAAQKIQDRQQKDYTDRAKQAKERQAGACGQQNSQQSMAVADFTSAYSAAQAQGIGTQGQGRGSSGGTGLSNGVAVTGSLITNERPGGGC